MIVYFLKEKDLYCVGNFEIKNNIGTMLNKLDDFKNTVSINSMNIFSTLIVNNLNIFYSKKL